MELSQHSPGMFDTLLELESKWREPRLLPIVYGKQEFALLNSLFHASERMQMASTFCHCTPGICSAIAPGFEYCQRVQTVLESRKKNLKISTLSGNLERFCKFAYLFVSASASICSK